MKRYLAIFILALLFASCDGGGPRFDRPDDPGAPPALRLPTPIAADPSFLAYSETPLDDMTIDRLLEIKGLAAAGAASIGEFPVSGPAGRGEMRVAAVDPLDFRPVAPETTRDASFVWSEMVSGEAVVTFAGAEALGLDDEARITVGDTDLVVGAFADNGVPNIAEVVVNEQVGRDLGLEAKQWLVIGTRPEANLGAVRKDVEALLPSARVAQLLSEDPDLFEPGDPEAVGEVTGSLIGTMEFNILDDGFIKPEREWVRQNIATAEVTILGEVTCHRLLIPQLQAALTEISEEGLADLIRPDDYGGCYVPRFIDRDPSLPLSMHAFGLAVDVNVSTNLLGTAGDQDPRIVEIFEKWGFEWGGHWDRPDPMHFELARIVET